MDPITIVVAVAGTAGGAIVGWLFASVRAGRKVQEAASEATRAWSERDAARGERARLDQTIGEMRGRLESEQQARATAEARFKEAEVRITELRQFIEET